MTWDNFIEKLFSVQVLIALIGSSVVAALVGKFNNDRNLKLKYITEERSKWRERVKEHSSKIISKSFDSNEKLIESITWLQLSLNPNDDNEKQIISCLERIKQDPNNDDERNLLRKMVSQLLKHDWERAKKEARVFLKWPKPKRKLQ